jgi:hypothetical protein
MDKKTLLFLVIGVLVAFLAGFGGIWFMLDSSQAGKSPPENPASGGVQKKDAGVMATSTFDLFQLNFPCKADAEGNTPMVHADFQLVVPIRHRIKVEENSSRLRDMIATLARHSDVSLVYHDVDWFKKQIIAQARETLGIEIENVLILRIDYDIIPKRH